jgi:predicted ATPase
MVGRDPDVVEVTALLGSRRLVTVLGAGGIGKTRLALQVAHHLPPPTGGVWLIRLDGLRAGTELARVVA